MTLKELIEKAQALPKEYWDLEVLVEGGCVGVGVLELVQRHDATGPEDLDGAWIALE